MEHICLSETLRRPQELIILFLKKNFLRLNSKNEHCKKKKNSQQIFNTSWTQQYFFIESNEKPFYLICYQTVGAIKEYNLKRRFESLHKSSMLLLDKDQRKRKLNSLILALESRRKFFKKSDSENKAVSRVSFEISQLIAKRMKPFQDGYYIKDAIAIFCKNVPEKETTLKNVSLSRHTVTRGIGETSTHIQGEISKLSDDLEFYSLAIDKSNDICDTAQLAVSICGMCSDGAPAMSGNNQGVTARLFNHLAELNLPSNVVIWYHCIIHQSVFCCKVLDLKNVMDVVVKIINYSRSHALNHRQFKELLNRVENESGDV